MKHFHDLPPHNFQVIAGTSRSQAAVMTLEPHAQTGGADNRHAESNQWLFALSGQGEAIVEGETLRLSPGTLLLIEAGEGHEIRNTGDDP